MSASFTHRLLAPIVQVRNGESTTALLMFAYSFLAIASYNIIKPITKSKFIEGLGADNLPYVIIGASLLIGVLMQGYSKVMTVLPRRWAISILQAAMAGLLLAFWFFFQTGQAWVPVAFYFVGLILGVLLISQFWTLANLVYDPRQAKRLFGFIGGGAPLGGIVASALLSGYAKQIGTVNFLLVSAGLLGVCVFIVMVIVQREKLGEQAAAAVSTGEEGVGGAEALRMLRESKHLQIIALIIGFAAVGAAVIDQQLSMAAQASKGQGAVDAITEFLAQVQLWMSTIAFVIQVWLTSRIHRLLGIGFALMVLPVTLGTTGVIMIFNAALWAPALARIADQSLRYTIDKTSREILFLPLPNELKYKVKPFVDVTVDRFAKGAGALLALVLIKPWGFSLNWQQVSYGSLVITGLWILMALRARRGYLAAFRRSIERRDMQPTELRLSVADPSTVETLVEELASPDERRVLYAIDLLESLDKRNLITPLLLHHESEEVRVRALLALGSARPETAERWLPAIERMLKDGSAAVRAAAVRALADIRKERAAEMMRPYLEDRDARVAVTAAVALAGSRDEADLLAAEQTLRRLADDTRQAGAPGRQEVAAAIAQVQDPRFRRLLIPLMHDPSLEVAQEAVRSARVMGTADFLFVPPLVSLLRQRLLKASARDVLVSYGEAVVDTLAYFLRDPDEDIWVRRHIPATLALIPCQQSLDVLVNALADPDGFLRYKAVAAIEKLRRERPDLRFDREAIEKLTLGEGRRYFNYLSLHYNLSRAGETAEPSLLARALEEKLRRTKDRVYRLLGLVYPWKDIAAARWAIERGDPRSRASASEYLDNLLSGPLRKLVIPLVEEMPLDEKVRRGNVLLRTRVRDAEETLTQLVHDEDQVVAAAAIHLVEARQRWDMAADLEHILAHRDAKDWYVFEAASWALAARRFSPDERRARWMEPLPAVELADRFRRMPLFDFVSVDELFRIAGAGRQVRHEAGHILYQAGASADSLQFLLDGKVETEAPAGAPARQTEPPAPLAVEEVLEGRPMRETVRAVEAAICLALSADGFLTVLSDNIELAQGLFRMALDARAPRLRSAVWRGEARDEVARLAGGALTPIDTVLVLQAIPLFTRMSGDQLLSLAAIARDAPLIAGADLWAKGDRPAIYVVLSGSLALEPLDGGEPELAAGGDAVGVYETLAGIPLERQGRVREAGRALRLDRDELFDRLADRIDLLQGLFSAVR